ncbi:hypothetical protein JCM10212_003775 [Sporobolomyces blumeae]
MTDGLTPPYRPPRSLTNSLFESIEGRDADEVARILDDLATQGTTSTGVTGRQEVGTNHSPLESHLVLELDRLASYSTLDPAFRPIFDLLVTYGRCYLRAVSDEILDRVWDGYVRESQCDRDGGGLGANGRDGRNRDRGGSRASANPWYELKEMVFGKEGEEEYPQEQERGRSETPRSATGVQGKQLDSPRASAAQGSRSDAGLFRRSRSPAHPSLSPSSEPDDQGPSSSLPQSPPRTGHAASSPATVKLYLALPLGTTSSDVGSLFASLALDLCDRPTVFTNVGLFARTNERRRQGFGFVYVPTDSWTDGTVSARLAAYSSSSSCVTGLGSIPRGWDFRCNLASSTDGTRRGGRPGSTFRASESTSGTGTGSISFVDRDTQRNGKDALPTRIQLEFETSRIWFDNAISCDSVGTSRRQVDQDRAGGDARGVREVGRDVEDLLCRHLKFWVDFRLDAEPLASTRAARGPSRSFDHGDLPGRDPAKTARVRVSLTVFGSRVASRIVDQLRGAIVPVGLECPTPKRRKRPQLPPTFQDEGQQSAPLVSPRRRNEGTLVLDTPRQLHAAS